MSREVVPATSGHPETRVGDLGAPFQAGSAQEETHMLAD